MGNRVVTPADQRGQDGESLPVALILACPGRSTRYLGSLCSCSEPSLIDVPSLFFPGFVSTDQHPNGHEGPGEEAVR